MPGNERLCLKKLLWIFAALFQCVIWTAPLSAATPGWAGVPQSLKEHSGFQHKGDFLYATGTAEASISIRGDKTHEIAEKKSLLRSLQLIHMGVACQDLLESLNIEDRQQFLRLFSPLVPAVRIQGVQVIRQWEDGQTHFTSVAVPLTAIDEIPWNFYDLNTAISRYLESEKVSVEGLTFCLRRVPRYSHLNRVIRQRIGKLYQQKGLNVLAKCFIKDQVAEMTISTLELLSLQNRLAQSALLTAKAEKMAEKSRWDDALRQLSQALDLTPTYSPAYLVLADYFLEQDNNPAFAFYAAEKALRDGTRLQSALKRIITCLKALNSPEAEVFEFLLSQCQLENKSFYFSSWKSELERFPDTSVPYLVMLSLGRAVEGESKAPNDEFIQASNLFGQAKSDDDIRQVLALLFKASEKRPLSAETFNLIGASYRHLCQFFVAFPFFWQALRMEPEYDYALTNLGICSERLGFMKSARFYFEHEAVKNSPSRWVQESYAKFHSANK